MKPIDEFAFELRDAYSTTSYGTWHACISMLRERGLNDKSVEGVIRSKLTRWAADEYGGGGFVPASALAAFLDRNPKYIADFS